MSRNPLDAIKIRAERATDGPWDVFDRFYVAQGDGVSIGNSVAKCETAADAKFIAHAREDISKLIGEVWRLHKELEKAEEHNVALAQRNVALKLKNKDLRKEKENEYKYFREALTFYANEGNWVESEVPYFDIEGRPVMVDDHVMLSKTCKIKNDRGEIAREVLDGDKCS